MRQIVLDTETTGLDCKNGDRIIEIGCVELVKRRLSGKTFHFYFNPDRLVEEEALKVHGISNEFLLNKPRFYECVEEFMDFIRGAELIIHNAEFDVGFINTELALLRRNPYGTIEEWCSILDTLTLARQLHPGQRNSLDALCKRYQINNAHRKLHGALLDAEILAHLYLAMTGGQKQLFVPDKEADQDATQVAEKAVATREYQLRLIKASAEEEAAHQAYLAKLEA